MIIRQAQITDAPLVARLQVKAWRDLLRGRVADKFLVGLSYDKQTDFCLRTLGRGAGSKFMYLAELQPGQVVGFLSGGPARSDNQDIMGDVYTLFVLEEYRNQGVGTLLFSAAARRFAQDGFRSFAVSVLEINPSRAFFEKMGGQVLDERVAELEGNSYVQVSYEWPLNSCALDRSVQQYAG